MKSKNYSVSININADPDNAYKCINSVTKWWTENLEGKSEKLNEEFTVRFGEVHVSTQKVTELIPGKRIVWLITKSNLNFIKNKSEWTNTRVIFEITHLKDKTVVTFTHEGLNPGIECYGPCSGAWGEYIEGSLYKLIETGKGEPTPKES